MDQGCDDPLAKVNLLGIFLGLQTEILMAKEPNGMGKNKEGCLHCSLVISVM